MQIHFNSSDCPDHPFPRHHPYCILSHFFPISSMGDRPIGNRERKRGRNQQGKYSHHDLPPYSHHSHSKPGSSSFKHAPPSSPNINGPPPTQSPPQGTGNAANILNFSTPFLPSSFPPPPGFVNIPHPYIDPSHHISNYPNKRYKTAEFESNKSEPLSAPFFTPPPSHLPLYPPIPHNAFYPSYPHPIPLNDPLNNSTKPPALFNSPSAPPPHVFPNSPPIHNQDPLQYPNTQHQQSISQTHAAKKANQSKAVWSSSSAVSPHPQPQSSSSNQSSHHFQSDTIPKDSNIDRDSSKISLELKSKNQSFSQAVVSHDGISAPKKDPIHGKASISYIKPAATVIKPTESAPHIFAPLTSPAASEDGNMSMIGVNDKNIRIISSSSSQTSKMEAGKSSSNYHSSSQSIASISKPSSATPTTSESLQTFKPLTSRRDEYDKNQRQEIENSSGQQTKTSRDSTPSIDKSQGSQSGDHLAVDQIEGEYRELPGPLRTKIEDYVLMNEISEGAYGVVYKGYDQKRKEFVAMKKVKIDGHKEKEAGFPVSSVREIRTLASMRHENIVNFRDLVSDESSNTFYIILDYVEYDLHQYLKLFRSTGNSPFSEPEVKSLTQQLLKAIEFLHHKKIMHRDIKASNLLVSAQGKLFLADFGLSRECVPNSLKSPTVVTLSYRPPEIAFGAPNYDLAVDLWSVGCIMAELLLGRPFIRASSELELMSKLIEIFGTPNELNYGPEFKNLEANRQLQMKPSNSNPTDSSRLKEFFPKLSRQGFDLISKLLCYNPQNRITAEAAARHPWFKEYPAPTQPSLPQITHALPPSIDSSSLGKASPSSGSTSATALPKQPPMDQSKPTLQHNGNVSRTDSLSSISSSQKSLKSSVTGSESEGKKTPGIPPHSSSSAFASKDHRYTQPPPSYSTHSTNYQFNSSHPAHYSTTPTTPSSSGSSFPAPPSASSSGYSHTSSHSRQDHGSHPKLHENGGYHHSRGSRNKTDHHNSPGSYVPPGSAGSRYDRSSIKSSTNQSYYAESRGDTQSHSKSATSGGSSRGSKRRSSWR